MANPIACELVYGKCNKLGLVHLGIIGACILVEVIELYIVEEACNIPVYFLSIVVSCSNLADSANGQVDHTGTTFGQTATYSCNTGSTWFEAVFVFGSFHVKSTQSKADPFRF